jgi:hypothetical protein
MPVAAARGGDTGEDTRAGLPRKAPSGPRAASGTGGSPPRPVTPPAGRRSDAGGLRRRATTAVGRARAAGPEDGRGIVQDRDDPSTNAGRADPPGFGFLAVRDGDLILTTEQRAPGRQSVSPRPSRYPTLVRSRQPCPYNRKLARRCPRWPPRRTGCPGQDVQVEGASRRTRCPAWTGAAPFSVLASPLSQDTPSERPLSACPNPRLGPTCLS